MTLDQIRARMGAILTELEAINRQEGDLPPTEQARWDRLNEEFHDLRIERDLAIVRSQIASGVTRTIPGTPFDPDDNGAVAPGRTDVRAFAGDPWVQRSGALALSPRDLRGRAMRAIELSTDVAEEGRQRIVSQLLERGTDEERDITARWAVAVSDPAYARAWAQVMRDPARGHLLWTPEELAAFQRAQRVRTERAMGLTDTVGGFLVPFQLDPTVIVTTGGATNPIRDIARKVVASGDVWNGVSSTAVSWSFDAEAAPVSDDTTTFAQPSVTIRTARGFVPASLEVWMDARDILDTLQTLMVEGKNDLEAQKLVAGVAASNEPVGIVTKLTGTAAEITGTGESIPAGGAGAITDVYNLLNGLAPRWRSAAQWVADQTTLQAIGRLVPSGSTTDVPLLVDDRLLRKPYHEASYMDDIQLATVTATTRPLVVGDWQQYVIADRIGMVSEPIQTLFDQATGRPSGQRGLFCWYRVGADTTAGPAATGPFRMLKVITAA